MKLFANIGLLVMLVLVFIFSCGNPDLEVQPGTIEIKGHPKMPQIAQLSENLNIGEDEIAIYYYREDGDYEPWGFWLWAPGGGDGALNFDISSNLMVQDGVAYLRFFKDGSNLGQSAVNDAGVVGFIRRADNGWDGQSPDLEWQLDLGNEVVLFEDSIPNIYPVGEYQASIDSAKTIDTNLIRMKLSGRHGLMDSESNNGFYVVDAAGNNYPIKDMKNYDSRVDRNKNYANDIIVIMENDLVAGNVYFIGHDEYLADAKINSTLVDFAAIDEQTPDFSYKLGALYDQADGSAEFRVWSPYAKAVTVELFDTSIALDREAEAIAIVDLVQDQSTGVWTGDFSGRDADGLFYNYMVSQANGTTYRTLDPYAKSMDAYLNEGGAGRGAIVDSKKTLPENGWEGFENATDNGYYQVREDAIIYEVSVRDFTIDPAAGVSARPGSYEAFVEKIPYLVEMGVTHIQLMPVLNFYYTDETDTAYEDSGTSFANNYNWGYDPHSYFTPEGWFSSDPSDPYARIVELKELVKAVHQAGLRILLDVVYNHMATTDLLEQIVPNYYFRRTSGGGFTNSSGVGNDVASTRKMARKLIVDSTSYWVEEFNVDGFRFDLMGLIDTETMELAYAEAAKIKPDVLFQGEGWRMYNGPSGTRGTEQSYMSDTNNISVFNDEIRDLLKGGGLNDRRKGFITDQHQDPTVIINNLIGRPQSVYSADDPGDSMLYIAAHDNLSLADNIAFNLGLDNSVPEDRREIAQRAKLGNFLVLTGQGLAFIHSGQERGRSKPNIADNTREVLGDFVSNSYDSADNINQFDWVIPAEYEELRQFTVGLISIRKQYGVFRLASAAAINEAVEIIEQAGDFQLSYSLSNDEGLFFILVNSAQVAQSFELGTNVSGATVLVDQIASDAFGISSPRGVNISGSTVTLDALTPALLYIPR